MAADDGLIAPHSRDAARRLEQIRRALNVEIEALLRKLSTENGELVSTKDALAAARRIRTQVLSLLRQEGVPVVLSVAEVKIEEATDAALRAFTPSVSASTVTMMDPSARGTFEAEARDSIERAVSGALDGVADVFEDAADSMRKVIDEGVSRSWPQEELIREVQGKLESTFAQATTAVEGAIKGVAVNTLVEMAERGAEATGDPVGFLYDGPEDSKTRDFCDRHVGKVYTREALERLDNGTGMPVTVLVGGWRCRHRLSPISLDMAREEGYVVVTA